MGKDETGASESLDRSPLGGSPDPIRQSPRIAAPPLVTRRAVFGRDGHRCHTVAGRPSPSTMCYPDHAAETTAGKTWWHAVARAISRRGPPAEGSRAPIEHQAGPATPVCAGYTPRPVIRWTLPGIPISKSPSRRIVPRLRHVSVDDERSNSSHLRACGAGDRVSFELHPSGPAEMAERIQTVTAGHPWLVSEEAGVVLAYAYATAFRGEPPTGGRSRPPFTCTRSIGATAWAERCTRVCSISAPLGLRKRLCRHRPAQFGQRGPAPSLGFTRIGIFPKAGHKLGEWQTSPGGIVRSHPTNPPTEPEAPPEAQVRALLLSP